MKLDLCRWLAVPAMLALLATVAVACTGGPTPVHPGAPGQPGGAGHPGAPGQHGGAGDPGGTGEGDGAVLTIFARDRSVSAGLLALFTEQTGIEVRARYGGPTALTDQIIEDGADSPADVYYGPFSDALGSLSRAGRLAPIPDEFLERVPAAYRSPDGTWVGTDGRAHVVFYNTDLLSEADLPDSFDGFAGPEWTGRLAWDPSSRSLLDAVTGIWQVDGEEAARSWLEGIQAGEPATIGGAAAVIDVVSVGDLAQVGFGSHTYLPEMHSAGQAGNVAAKYYPGDAAGLVNAGGAGIIAGTDNREEAEAFIDFVTSAVAQQYFADLDAWELPMVDAVALPAGVPTAADLIVPGLDIRQFEELDAARELLAEVGIIL